LARKQMKWFKRFAGVRWTPGDSVNVQAILEEENANVERRS
jgi:tRNA A37 N6-isopentenylltransferase MiaA